jgi:hypothetical protein
VVLLVFVLPVALVGPMLPFVFTMVVLIGMVRFSSAESLAIAVLCIAAGVPGAVLICRRIVKQVVEASDAAADAAAEMSVEAVGQDS